MGDRILLLRLPAEIVLDCEMAAAEHFVVLVARLPGATAPEQNKDRHQIRCHVLNRNCARLEFPLRFACRGTCSLEVVPATFVVVVFVARYLVGQLVNRTRCKIWQFLRSSFRIRCRKNLWLHLLFGKSAMAE